MEDYLFLCLGGESNTGRQPLPKAIWTISSSAIRQLTETELGASTDIIYRCTPFRDSLYTCLR